jgi:hypothetical protein
MLRSGSAFQYNLVCSLLEKVGLCVRHGRWEPKEKITKSQLLKWANDSKVYHVVKSARYPEEFELAQQGLAKMCYINRDIRDVAIAAKFKWKLIDDDLMVMLDRALSGYELMEKMNAFGMPWCLHQRYEDVFINTDEAVKEIANFLKVSPSEEVIKKVVKECSIDVMESVSKSRTLILHQRILRRLGKIANYIKRFLPPPLNNSWGFRKIYLAILPKVDQRTCIAPRHIETTKGVPGSWKKELNQGEKQIITDRYQEYLKKESYSYHY